MDQTVGQAADTIPIGAAPDQAPAPPPNLNDPNGPLAVGAQRFISDMNPAPVAKAVAKAVGAHPFDPVGSAVAAIANPMIAQSAQRLAAARTALAQGDHSTAALHFLGTVPVVGPIADDLLSAVRSGDTTKAAKALADAAALAGPTLLSGGADAAAEAAAPKVGAAAQDAAEGQMAGAMAPRGGWNRSALGKTMSAQAERVAPDVLAAGPLAVRDTGLGKFVDQQLQGASDAWQAAEDNRQVGRPIDTGPIIAKLQAKLDSLTGEPVAGSQVQRTPVTATSPVLGPNGRPIQTTSMQSQPIGQAVQGPNRSPQVAVLQDAINRVKQLGQTASYEALRTIRQDYDAGSNYRPGIATASDVDTAAEQKAAGNKAVAGAIRGSLATSDPKLAAANANLAIWQRASDVMDAADDLNRSAPNGGSAAAVMKMLPMTLGAGLAGDIIGGSGASAVGGFLGLALKGAKDAGFTTKVATARVLGSISSAIRAGDATAFMRGLSALASVTGTQVPVFNQSLANSSGPAIFTPQDNVNLAANRGGGS